MLTFNFNPFPVLTTERLVLRRTNYNDVDEIFFHRSDPRMMQYIDRPPATHIAEAYHFVKRVEDNIERNEAISWAITLKGDDRMIGSMAIWRIVPEHHRGEIGYVLHPDHWGKGIAHEAAAAVLHYAFHTMRLHSIEANTHPDNKPSQNVLLRHGFVQEAYFKENYYCDGKFTDSVIFSLLTPLR